MQLIIGLGNYPDKYKETRHNIGFLFLDELAKRYNFPHFRYEKKFFGEISAGEIEGEKVLLLKPHTYMNLSGKSVQAVMHFYKIIPAEIVVVVDEVEMNFGDSKWREKGSSGGHNGIKSIIESTGTQEFPRLKLGISNENRSKMPTDAFVLQKFSAEELSQINDIINTALPKLVTHIQ